jgi:hypothetical protein
MLHWMTQTQNGSKSLKTSLTPEPILGFVEGIDPQMKQFGPLPKWMSARLAHHCSLSVEPHRPPLPTPTSSGEQRCRTLLALPPPLVPQDLHPPLVLRAPTWQPSFKLWWGVGTRAATCFEGRHRAVTYNSERKREWATNNNPFSCSASSSGTEAHG